MKYLENCDLITYVPQHLQCGKFGDGGVGGALDLYVPLAMRWVCVENKNNRCIKIGISGILHVNN